MTAKIGALAGVAQLVEHQLPKLRVVGSNPIARLKEICNDHDSTCVGTNIEGGHTGEPVAAELWLKDWMPPIQDRDRGR